MGIETYRNLNNKSIDRPRVRVITRLKFVAAPTTSNYEWKYGLQSESA